MNFKRKKSSLKVLTVAALSSLLMFTGGNSKSYAEETDVAAEKFNMPAFEQLMNEIEQGIIKNETQGLERFEELEKTVPNENNKNDIVLYSWNVETALKNAKEAAACSKVIGTYKCGVAGVSSRTALSTARSYYAGESLSDGLGDAFRHSYWNALMSREIGVANAKFVGDLHEYFNWGGQKRYDMDSYNNMKGRDMYQWRVHNGWATNNLSMINNLREDIKSGLLKHISYSYSPEGSLFWTNQH